MVTNATSFSRSGLSDWLLQRLTALILAAYTLFLVGYLALHPDLDYAAWARLFAGLPMKLFTLAAAVSLAIHAWIGLWTVLTDYVTERLLGPVATPLRLALEIAMILVNLGFAVWAIDILWGV
ncbi:MAG: succinate dehydrogenase hydrophobic membrane anchor subunit [Porticoccaceae bacterium]|nr:MAG: succinate dehydrogenase hydrophobic membrane anchor subunit [Porticoccaceae bacterium]